jgi:hypothetical protein
MVKMWAKKYVADKDFLSLSSHSAAHRTSGLASEKIMSYIISNNL